MLYHSVIQHVRTKNYLPRLRVLVTRYSATFTFTCTFPCSEFNHHPFLYSPCVLDIVFVNCFCQQSRPGGGGGGSVAVWTGALKVSRRSAQTNKTADLFIGEINAVSFDIARQLNLAVRPTGLHCACSDSG